MEKIFRNGGYFEIFNLNTAGDFSLVQCHDRATIKTIFIYTLHSSIYLLLNISKDTVILTISDLS